MKKPYEQRALGSGSFQQLDRALVLAEADRHQRRMKGRDRALETQRAFGDGS